MKIELTVEELHGIMGEREVSSEETIKTVNELLRAVSNGQKIAAIKAYRTLTGLGLKDSKDGVESAVTDLYHVWR